MNYQQTKTIQKRSINKNLLLLGLLVFASFAQACGGGKKGSKGSGDHKVDNQAMLTTLGNFDNMTFAKFEEQVVKDAKERDPKLITIYLENKEIKTLKLPKEMEMEDVETKKTDKVPYFKALGGKLVKGKGMLKGEEVVENTAITGLFKVVLDEFSKNNEDKHAKVFVLARLLELEEAVKAATSKEAVQEAVKKFKEEVAKVKGGAQGVLVVVSDTDISFKDLTEKDNEKLKGMLKKVKKGCKYTLNKDLYQFIEDKVVKPIEEAAEQIN